MFLGLSSLFVFATIRDALPGNPVAQEHILGAFLSVMAVADVTNIVASFIGIPGPLKYRPDLWNPAISLYNMTCRVAWFSGIGHKRYYFGQRSNSINRDGCHIVVCNRCTTRSSNKNGGTCFESIRQSILCMVFCNSRI
ncbi:hypothetical protein EDB87DRAFT_329936 [Lactarius vividus]|nr:hypothetical protein EDB87DRAFT_329936 [Lactarius vividus]